jgi:indolepyruvate ferredoxin oxidoreductase beta subunit
MKCDLIFAGVGGQGILLPSAILAAAAMEDGLHARQSEVHGMAQRGASVESHLRLSDSQIYSELIPEGTADLILAMEPLESLRYLRYLSDDGVLLTSTETVENISDYPARETLLEKLRSLPFAIVIDAVDAARHAGNVQASNMVMLGTAMRFLPVRPEAIEKQIEKFFSRKSEKLVDINLKAFRSGQGVTV